MTSVARFPVQLSILALLFLPPDFAFARDRPSLVDVFEPSDMLAPEGGVFAKYDWLGSTSLNPSPLVELAIACLKCQKMGNRVLAWEEAQKIVAFVSQPSEPHETIAYPAETIVAAMLLAGISAHEIGKYEFAHQCYRAAGQGINDKAGFPILAASLLYASAITYAAQERFDEALTVATKGAETAYQLRHDCPVLFCRLSCLKFALSDARSPRERTLLIDFSEFWEPRMSRVGIANAQVFLTLACSEVDSFSEACVKATSSCVAKLGASHAASLFLSTLSRDMSSKEARD